MVYYFCKKKKGVISMCTKNELHLILSKIANTAKDVTEQIQSAERFVSDIETYLLKQYSHP